MFVRARRTPRSAGFTLIELLVSITIMLLLMGFGIAAYLTLNSRQELLTSSKQLQQFMRAAQKKARAGEKPAGCDQLQGYQVSVSAAAGATVQLQAVCVSGTFTRDSFVFPASVHANSALSMQFNSLSGGVAGAGVVTLSGGGGKTYTFTVDLGGQITEGTLQ